LYSTSCQKEFKKNHTAEIWVVKGKGLLIAIITEYCRLKQDLNEASLSE